MKIPKIIHQIWSGINEPLPKHFSILGETWKRDYPSWKYQFWDNKRMNSFILKYYPQYWKTYNSFPYDVQRWDAIRYLILDRIGGMYVDFDYESLEPIDKLIKDKTCCFSQEPQLHCNMINKSHVFNNALMLSIPDHPFIKKVIQHVFSEKAPVIQPISKAACIMNTTGPWMLLNQYEHLAEQEKREIYLIPYRYVTPFDMHQAQLVRNGIETEELEICLQDAYAVHYYFGGWH